jgi:predicted enzyme related to lactoylglutathione lyase
MAGAVRDHQRNILQRRNGETYQEGDSSMPRSDQGAELKFVVTNTLIVGDIQRSVAFYRDVLGATVLREGEPTFLRCNIWLTINGGGGGTDDKPDVIASPPCDKNLLSIFLNLRVTDIRSCYDLWSSRGEIHHGAQSPRDRIAMLHERPGWIPH